MKQDAPCCCRHSRLCFLDKLLWSKAPHFVAGILGCACSIICSGARHSFYLFRAFLSCVLDLLLSNKALPFCFGHSPLCDLDRLLWNRTPHFATGLLGCAFWMNSSGTNSRVLLRAFSVVLSWSYVGELNTPGCCTQSWLSLFDHLFWSNTRLFFGHSRFAFLIVCSGTKHTILLPASSAVLSS